MKTTGRYSDYLQKRFLRYGVSIILAMYLVFFVFMVLNVLFATVLRTQRRSREIGEHFTAVFQSYAAGMDGFCTDETVRAALGGDAAARQAAIEALYGFSNSQSISSVFVLLDAGGEIFLSNLYANNQMWFLNSSLLKTTLEALDAEPENMVGTVSRLDYAYEQASDYLFARAVQDEEGGVLGYLFFDLKDAAIYRYLLAANLDQVTITDRFDNIVFSTHRQPPDPMEKYPAGRYRLEWKTRYTGVQNETEYFIDRQDIWGGALQIYALTNIEFQKQMFAYGAAILLLAGVVIIGVLLRLARRLARQNAAAIGQLVAAAEKIGGGDLDYQVDVQSFDEFRVMGDALNTLTSRLRQMIVHNEQLAENKRVLELKQLERQFNPHFIFNTMETIRYKIILEPDSAADMVFTFANLMRYGTNFGSNMVPLRTDIKFLQDYLSLQKMRFGEKLQVSFDVDEALLDCCLPKLLLQPLVENCLTHGMKKIRSIAIEVAVRQKGGDIVLDVRDNGDGIPPDILEKVERRLASGLVDARHFGVSSVARTLQLVYGGAATLSLRSGPGKGTLVQITLPRPPAAPTGGEE